MCKSVYFCPKLCIFVVHNEPVEQHLIYHACTVYSTAVVEKFNTCSIETKTLYFLPQIFIFVVHNGPVNHHCDVSVLSLLLLWLFYENV